MVSAHHAVNSKVEVVSTRSSKTLRRARQKKDNMRSRKVSWTKKKTWTPGCVLSLSLHLRIGWSSWMELGGHRFGCNGFFSSLASRAILISMPFLTNRMKCLQYVRIYGFRIMTTPLPTFSSDLLTLYPNCRFICTCL